MTWRSLLNRGVGLTLSTLLLVGLVACGGSKQKADGDNAANSKTPAAKVAGPNRVAREFSEALAAKDTVTLAKRSGGPLHELFSTIEEMKRLNDQMIAEFRKRYPKQSEGNHFLRKTELNWSQVFRFYLNEFKLDGLLREEPSSGQNVYQVLYASRGEGTKSQELTVTRGDDGIWRATRLDDPNLSPQLTTALKNELNKLRAVSRELVPLLDKEKPRTIEQAMGLAQTIMQSRVNPDQPEGSK